MNFKKRLTDWLFWLTIIALFASSTGFNWEEFKTWNSFFVAIYAIFCDPSRFITFVIAFIGLIRNSATKGLKD